METKKIIRNKLLVMAAGVLLNLGFYEAAHLLHLPMWLDSIGTAYAAVVLEPAAGLLAAFATNFYQAAVIYDSSSIVYYVVSAAAALSFGILLRKNGKISWKRLPQAMGVYIISATLLSGLLTLWRKAGIPDSGWERTFYEMALDWGAPQQLGCFFGAFILKISDTIVMAAILPLLYRITPASARTEELSEPVSWKNPYWGIKSTK